MIWSLPIFEETYFGLFVLGTAMAYAGVMIILMYSSRATAYVRYLQDHLEEQKRQPRAVLAKPLSLKTWSKTYDVGADPHYIFLWSAATRGFSTIHAVVMVTTPLLLLWNYDLVDLWEYHFYMFHPEGETIIANLNAFMLSYLLIDASYLIAHRIQLPANAESDDNFIFALLHHLVGAFGMLQFIQLKIMPFNCLYYSFTEISTVPLNAAWLSIKMGWDKNRRVDIVYRVSAGLTWLLFFEVRIVGSIAVIAYLYFNLHHVMLLSPTICFLTVATNAIVIGLNYYWFYKLTLKALEIFNGHQKRD